MYDFFKKKEPTELDRQIDVILAHMKREGPDSDKYPTLMTHLERLHDIKTQERPERVKRDTIALIAGNLAGILVIVAYEQKHIMSTKGFSQLIRPKMPN